MAQKLSPLKDLIPARLTKLNSPLYTFRLPKSRNGGVYQGLWMLWNAMKPLRQSL